LGTYRGIGTRTQTLSSGSIIPPLPSDSLTTGKFRWLHPEAWNDDQMTWFAANRQGALPPFDKGVPFVHGRRDPAPARMGRYLLESEETPRLWAEVFGFRRRFVTYEIVLGGPTWEAAFEAPLATLVGAVALNAHADLL